MKKKKYCPTVCSSDRTQTYFREPRFGRKKRLETMDPKRIVITPARKNLAPASMILEAVSSWEIPKSSYAVLMAGDALPHNTQQKSAVRNVTGSQLHTILFRPFKSLYLNPQSGGTVYC